MLSFRSFFVLFLVFLLAKGHAAQSAGVLFFNDTACSILLPTDTGITQNPVLGIPLNTCYEIPTSGSNENNFLNVTQCGIGGFVNVSVYTSEATCNTSTSVGIQINTLDLTCYTLPLSLRQHGGPSSIVVDCTSGDFPPSFYPPAASSSSSSSWTTNDTIIISATIGGVLLIGVLIGFILCYCLSPKRKGYRR